MVNNFLSTSISVDLIAFFINWISSKLPKLEYSYNFENPVFPCIDVCEYNFFWRNNENVRFAQATFEYVSWHIHALCESFNKASPSPMMFLCTKIILTQV